MSAQREQNRRDMPRFSAWIDSLRAAGFTIGRVIFAEENGKTIGKEET